MEFNYKKDIESAKNLLELSNKEIAKFFNVSRMTFFRWWSGRSQPTYQNLNSIYGTLYANDIKINEIKSELYKSRESSFRKILYHGAKSEIVGNVTVNKGEEKKDFGKAFYLGESLLQSASFISNYPSSCVYVFECNFKNLKTKEYDVSIEWMVLVSYFRQKLEPYKKSKFLQNLLLEIEGLDLVIAPIADNTIYDLIDSFAEGDITDLQCIHALSANWLGKQYVFLNDNAINKSLKMIDRLFLCDEEKDFYNKRREENTKIGKDKMKLAKREFAGKGKYIEELLKWTK